MAEGDDENKYFEPTEVEYETTGILARVKSDTKGKSKPGIIPDPNKKSEDPRHTSKSSDSPETSMSSTRKPPRKEKSKTVVRINPDTAIVEHEPEEFKKAYGPPPYTPSDLSVNHYEWKQHLFCKPLKSALKLAKDQTPKDPDTLTSMPPKVPSRMLPIRSPSSEELAGDVSKMTSKPSKDSSPMPLTQPDPNITQTQPLSEHVSTLQPMKDTTSTLPHVRISRANILPSILQKDTEASASPSGETKEPTKLPPIPAKDKSVSLPDSELSSFKSKKPELSKPPTEPKTTLPPITKPPKLFRKHFKKSSTWSVVTEEQFPPVLPKDSTKRPPTASGNIPAMHFSQLPPIKSSGTMLTTSPKEPGVLPLKSPESKSLELPIQLSQSSVSPEKPLKVKSKKTTIYAAMDIHIANPKDIQEFIRVQITDAYYKVPVVYHDLYNLKLLPYSMNRFQLMIPDKSAEVYAILKRECLEGYKCVNWSGADISTVFNIDDYKACFRRLTEVNMEHMAREMKLHMNTSETSLHEFDAAILQPLRIQIMGSIVACQLAIEEGWAINIGGGFSHESANEPIGGFHIYDDLLVCLAVMSKSPKVDKILVVNLDAYQCLKYEFDLVGSRTISCPLDIIDVYSQEIVLQYGYAPDCFDRKIGRDESSVDVYHAEHQLTTVSKHFDQCIAELQKEMSERYERSCHSLPSLCIYVAGSYALKEFCSTSMSLTEEEIVKRDQAVFELVHKTYKIPIAILLGGGYRPDDVKVAGASFSNLCQIAIPLLRWMCGPIPRVWESEEAN